MWLKDVILDLAIAVCVVALALFGAEWAYWVLVIYTPFMVLLKGVAAFAPTMARGKKKVADGPPAWFFHVLYGASVMLLGYSQQWWIAAGWLAIWLLSAVAERR
jgi:hypothetical protein